MEINVSTPSNLIQMFVAICCFIALGGMSYTVIAQENDGATLKIGSEAPDLDIENWLSDNAGEFPHTTRIEEGKIYVIEFWATWCKPCVEEMPRIAELQKMHADNNVQFISISDEDPETIENFLKRNVAGDTTKTYGELTQSYCLTSDPDKSVKKDYFRAAKQSGIPCTFIVGRTGFVEWIGNTAQLEEPLGKIVNDEWDRAEFLTAYHLDQQARKRATMARRRMAESVDEFNRLVRENKNEEAVKLINGLISDKDLSSRHESFRWMRLQVLVRSNLSGADIALSRFVEKNKYDTQRLNEIAWGIYLKFEGGDDVDESLLEQAKITAEYAVRAAPESGAVLDTLAHLVYVVDCDLDRALTLQKRAVRLAGPRARDLMPFLNDLEEEKRSGKKAGRQAVKTDSQR